MKTSPFFLDIDLNYTPYQEGGFVSNSDQRRIWLRFLAGFGVGVHLD
jgi:hypothetical protein